MRPDELPPFEKGERLSVEKMEALREGVLHTTTLQTGATDQSMTAVGDKVRTAHRYIQVYNGTQADITAWSVFGVSHPKKDPDEPVRATVKMIGTGPASGSPICVYTNEGETIKSQAWGHARAIGMYDTARVKFSGERPGPGHWCGPSLTNLTMSKEYTGYIVIGDVKDKSDEAYVMRAVEPISIVGKVKKCIEAAQDGQVSEGEIDLYYRVMGSTSLSQAPDPATGATPWTVTVYNNCKKKVCEDVYVTVSAVMGVGMVIDPGFQECTNCTKCKSGSSGSSGSSSGESSYTPHSYSYGVSHGSHAPHSESCSHCPPFSKSVVQFPPICDEAKGCYIIFNEVRIYLDKVDCCVKSKNGVSKMCKTTCCCAPTSGSGQSQSQAYSSQSGSKTSSAGSSYASKSKGSSQSNYSRSQSARSRSRSGSYAKPSSQAAYSSKSKSYAPSRSRSYTPSRSRSYTPSHSASRSVSHGSVSYIPHPSSGAQSECTAACRCQVVLGPLHWMQTTDCGMYQGEWCECVSPGRQPAVLGDTERMQCQQHGWACPGDSCTWTAVAVKSWALMADHCEEGCECKNPWLVFGSPDFFPVGHEVWTPCVKKGQGG